MKVHSWQDMNTDLAEKLKAQMGYTTLKISCQECRYWREENTKHHYLSICTFNNIGEMKITSLGRCDFFARKEL